MRRRVRRLALFYRASRVPRADRSVEVTEPVRNEDPRVLRGLDDAAAADLFGVLLRWLADGPHLDDA